jgi:hypothetical protein
MLLRESNRINDGAMSCPSNDPELRRSMLWREMRSRYLSKADDGALSWWSKYYGRVFTLMEIELWAKEVRRGLTKLSLVNKGIFKLDEALPTIGLTFRTI